MATISNSVVVQLIKSQTDYRNILFTVWTLGDDAEAIELRHDFGDYNADLQAIAWQNIITISGSSPYTYTLSVPTNVFNTYFTYQLRVRNTDGTYGTANIFSLAYLLPPEAPQNLSVFSTTGGAVTLDWDDANAGFLGDATGWQYSFDDATWNNLGGLTGGVIGGLAPSTAYTVYIRGLQDQTSPDLLGASASISATTTIATTPSAPLGFSVDTQQTTADLSWRAPIDTGGVTITGYRVRWNQGTTPGGTWQNVGNVNTYQGTGLNDGELYTFQVQAVNSVGNGSITTRQVSTTGVPDAPINLSVEAFSVLMVFTWEAPSHLGFPELNDYEIRYIQGATPGGTWEKIGSTETRYEVSGLEPGTEYTLQVRGREPDRRRRC